MDLLLNSHNYLPSVFKNLVNKFEIQLPFLMTDVGQYNGQYIPICE